MQKLIRFTRYGILSAILIAGFTSPGFGQNFEGIIHYEFSGMDDGRTFKYMINGSRIRMELDSSNPMGGAMLFLPERSQMIILMDRMKAYMKMDLEDAAFATGQQKDMETSMQKTGITKTIAGYSCEVWEITVESSGEQMNMCMTQELGNFMIAGKFMNRNNAPEWARQIAGKGYVPLEVVTDMDGEKEVMMKATKIEKKQLDDTLFEIPEGYRDMSSMMQQMQKMRDQQ